VAERHEQSFEAPGHASVRVEIPAGVLAVETWREPRVEVEVTPAHGDERSAAAAAETRISTTERAGRREVVVRAPKREGKLGIAWGRGPELAVRVRCPEGTDVGWRRRAPISRRRGRWARVGPVGVGRRDLAGRCVPELRNGERRPLGRLDRGELTAKSASGDVDVRAVGGAGSVNTVSGDVRIGATGDTLAVRTVSGDVDVEAAAAGVVIGSVSGDVEVGAVPGLVLWIDAQSVSGTMTSELDVGDEPAADGGRRWSCASAPCRATFACRAALSPRDEPAAAPGDAGSWGSRGRLAAAPAGPAQNDLVLVERVAEPAGRAGERLLERRVGERLDAAAVVAHEMVMVLVMTAERLEACDPVADVDALYDPELGQRVEGPVDARDPDRAPGRRDPVVDLLGGAAAVLRLEKVDHRAPRAAPAESRHAEGVECVVGPAHRIDDTDSHPLLASGAMLSRIVLLCAAAGGMLALAGCGGSAASGGKGSVVAAFYPLAFAAEQVAAPAPTWSTSRAPARSPTTSS
jgi:hypothetical protein